MKNLLFFFLFYLALLIMEVAVSIGCLLVASSEHRGVVDGVGLWTLWRVIFYGLPSLAAGWALGRSSTGAGPTHRLIRLAAVNLLTYAGLSVGSERIWGRNVPLPAEGLLFWGTCAALLVSPLLLGQIPFFRHRIPAFYLSDRLDEQRKGFPIST